MKMKKETHRNWLVTEYYDNGQKKKVSNYKDDKLNGKLTYWDEYGQRKSGLLQRWKDCLDGKKDFIKYYYIDSDDDVLSLL